MISIRMLVVAYIVVGVLDLYTRRSQKSEKKNTQKKFVVRAPIEFAFLGGIVIAIIIGILIWGEVTKQYLHPILLWGLIIFGGGLGFLLMIAPIKGVWDVIVDRDDITVVKAFIFKRHWKFSTIVRCKQTRGGAKMYVEGRKRKAFFVDGMVDGSNLFMKRIEEAGIPIE